MQQVFHRGFSANSACSLPSISALIKYHHATARFPVKETWCQAIKQVNYATWSGLTTELARRNCPNSEEKNLGTMSLKRKNIRSTKVNVIKLNAANQHNVSTKVTKFNEAYFFTQHSSKIYSD